MKKLVIIMAAALLSTGCVGKQYDFEVQMVEESKRRMAACGYPTDSGYTLPLSMLQNCGNPPQQVIVLDRTW